MKLKGNIKLSTILLVVKYFVNVLQIEVSNLKTWKSQKYWKQIVKIKPISELYISDLKYTHSN